MVYRFQIWLWAVFLILGLASTLLFLADGYQRIVAWVVMGVSVLAAAAVWRFGEYRAYRLGPPTTTGFNGWTLVGVFAMVVIANMIAKGGSFGASVAGIATAVAGVAPWLIFTTAFRDPPPTSDSGDSELRASESDRTDLDQAGPNDGSRL